jgi:hypothetical protein
MSFLLNFLTHPFRRPEAQCDTVVISLSPSVRFNLLISRMHASFCLLKHVINPRSPRTVKYSNASNQR